MLTSGVTGGGGGGGGQGHRQRQGGGRVPRDIFHREIFADLPGKRENGKLKIEGESHEIFFFFFFFCLLLFKTTKICLGPTKIEKVFPENHISRREKNLKKLTLPPLKNTPLTPPVLILSGPGQAKKFKCITEQPFCSR